MGISITGTPGYRTERTHNPRRVRRPSDARYLDGGVLLNGSLSGDATNTGFVHVLQPGAVIAKQNSGGKWRNPI